MKYKLKITSDEIKKADKWSKRELYKINYQRLQVNKRLREENERLNKDLDTAIEICNNRQKEIVRLNNIINEFEKWLEEHSQLNFNYSDKIIHEQLALGMAFEYLKELKGSDKK